MRNKKVEHHDIGNVFIKDGKITLDEDAKVISLDEGVLLMKLHEGLIDKEEYEQALSELDWLTDDIDDDESV